MFVGIMILFFALLSVAVAGAIGVVFGRLIGQVFFRTPRAWLEFA